MLDYDWFFWLSSLNVEVEEVLWECWFFPAQMGCSSNSHLAEFSPRWVALASNQQAISWYSWTSLFSFPRWSHPKLPSPLLSPQNNSYLWMMSSPWWKILSICTVIHLPKIWSRNSLFQETFPPPWHEKYDANGTICQTFQEVLRNSSSI